MCFLLCSLYTVVDAKNKKASVSNELQILIDVSGSMKKNDPKNLRIPAVKLLINLLPKGTKAGIWLFAENTKPLIKTGIVNKQWKKKALLKLNRIHSRGLFTNIEQAIQKGAGDWFKSDEKHNRHLILLTDGMVDVSKDIMQSAESRARVMTDLVPLLQQAGVKVQTIALSKEADIELLSKLAIDTGGWSETALKATELQKIFLKLFKNAVPQDSVPLDGNVFSIDKSIKEFSVLIFKQVGSEQTTLITPRNKKINHKTTLRKVAWVAEKNYDLVTITDPKAGEWKIIGKMDPDNQVMIVTDLKLEIDEIPNYVLVNDSVNVSGFFTNQQQLISRQDFLDLIDLSITLDDGQKMKMSAVPGKQGLFSKTLASELKTGRHTLTVIADGKTFKRELSKTIEVIDSLIKVDKQIDLATEKVLINLTPNNLAINTDMMTIEASISQLGKETKSQELDKKGDHWQLSVAKPKQGSKLINFSVIANTAQGQSISPSILPVVVNARLFNPPKPEPDVIKPANKEQESLPIEKVEKKLKKQTNKVIKAVKSEEEPVNWGKTIFIVVVINVLLIAGGFFGYKFLKKKSVNNQEELLSRLD